MRLPPTPTAPVAIDVHDVDGVFAGWTASDIVASASDISHLVYDVYGPEHKLVTAANVKDMYEQSSETG